MGFTPINVIMVLNIQRCSSGRLRGEAFCLFQTPAALVSCAYSIRGPRNLQTFYSCKQLFNLYAIYVQCMSATHQHVKQEGK